MMGNLKNVEIVYDVNRDVFLPGDTVKGRVIIDIERNEELMGLRNIKGISVRFRGKAKIVWITKDSQTIHSGHPDYKIEYIRARHKKIWQDGNSKFERHEAREHYFDSSRLLFGSDETQPDAQDMRLPSGRHNFPFEFLVPSKALPASFEGSNGYVRYKTKAFVTMSRFLKNKLFKTEKCFSLLGPDVDLNPMPNIEEPLESEDEVRNFCGCGPDLEAITLISLPKQGYVPGEPIYVTGNVDNRELSEHREFTATLIQKVSYQDERKIRETTKTVLAKMKSTVTCPRGRVSEIMVGPLPIPPVPSTGMDGCSLIDIEYYAQCRDKSHTIKFPITVGSVPLWNSAPMATVDQGATPADGPANHARPNERLRFSPPSYEQVTGEIHNIEKGNREDYFNDDQFLPKYLHFNLTTSEDEVEVDQTWA
ncbi:arrestin domain-containing protein 1-like [Patiria miniata]|uniref:Arrestin C-terminal-like domain-containing protein n=1 Tax=Patiria miniata TaxID=46514 RepID=A0A914ATX8_PATMI|nr:arrestin domain-containing protein 1-like [Patiria miniata]